MKPKLKVVEIYGPVMQGEGALIGLPTAFVRLGGCDFRCSWCDSMFAVDPARKAEWADQTADEIAEAVTQLWWGKPFEWVTLTGGNPALWDCASLVTMLQARGFRVAVETQGSKPAPWLGLADHLVLSPKPPSSGERCDTEALYACADLGKDVSVKVVVQHEDDLEFLAYIVEAFSPGLGPTVGIYAQPANLLGSGGASPVDLLARTRWLSEAVLERGLPVRVLPQLHALMYGGERGR